MEGNPSGFSGSFYAGSIPFLLVLLKSAPKLIKQRGLRSLGACMNEISSVEVEGATMEKIKIDDISQYGTAFNRCIACSSKSIYFWKTKDYAYTKNSNDLEFSIFRCKQCGTGFLNPPPSNNLLNEIYEYSGHALTSPVTLEEVLEAERKFPNSIIDAQRMADTAKRLECANNSRALDVGSGYGFYTRSLRSVGYSTVSINPGKYENAIFEEMNGDYPLPIMFDEYEDRNKFDVILMSQVLEHIAEPKKAIDKAVTLLNRDGIFVCAVPNFNSFSVRLFGTKDNGCLWVPEHVNYFTANGLESLLTGCGLEILHAECITRIRYGTLSRRLPTLKGASFLFDGFVKYAQLSINKVANLLGIGLYLNVYARKS